MTGFSPLVPGKNILQKWVFYTCKKHSDLVKLSEDLELSHQCLLIALGHHFNDIPFVGILYEYRPEGTNCVNHDLNDFVASVVVKTTRARKIKYLCGLQKVPLRNSHPLQGSLVCAAITGGRPLLWRIPEIEDAPTILVRPLLSADQKPYRVILLALPREQFGMLSYQVEEIEPIQVGRDVSCPSEDKCRYSHNCIWKSRTLYPD